MIKSTNVYFPSDEYEKSFINCIWKISEYASNIRKEMILPKGTAEIIFNFSDKIIYYNPSLKISNLLPSVFINGINFKPFELIKSGYQEFLGIQLKSFGLMMLFNISAKDFNDKVYDGKNIYPNLYYLADKLYCEQSFNQQVSLILKWIRKIIACTKKNILSINRIQKINNLIACKNITVKNISEEICLSERQLRRVSAEWLGMNTEEFIMYNRYLKCLNMLHFSKKNLTEIGLLAGYYDQSHFIREFKSFTNITPKKYREANKEIPGHIIY